ncbi:MAG: L-2-amino-thiazoline-4-carboxylic acid hydrolase [Firmicutes bacterium]|nr:L-2-amino-thiazoline-4-carboxylic acid hydrolase [Bacillota bacterium]
MASGVDRMARAMAAMYFFLAEEVVAAFGEEGRRALARGIRRFGLYRGGRIRKRVDAAGVEPTVKAFREFYDLPLGEAWESRRWATQDGQISEITYCPMAAEWGELGAGPEVLGYCAVDFAIAEGFDERLVFSRESSIPGGQDRCRHVLRMTTTIEEASRIRAESRSEG